jgi:hypothetical protein
MAGSSTAKMLICAALAGVVLISLARCEPSSGADMVVFQMTDIAPHPALTYFPELTRD